jgi:predicted lysophospholipase L1 biosynthesis ABC-type transport system permease subunit
MRPVQFSRWFPVYWLLTVIGQVASFLAFAVGAVAGVILFGSIFTLPPQSAPLGMVLIALILGFGFYSESRLSSKWKNATRRITERMERDIEG